MLSFLPCKVKAFFSSSPSITFQCLFFLRLSVLLHTNLPFGNHRNGFLWWKIMRGWSLNQYFRMQLNKHYAAQTQCLKSYSKSPSFLARCGRLIRDSVLKEILFILSVPLAMKETLGTQWPEEMEKHLPLWWVATQMWRNNKSSWIKQSVLKPHNAKITFV